MNGSLERLCAHAGVLRVGGQIGQPFKWAVTVLWIEPDAVEIKGLSGTFTRQDWRAVSTVLAAHGITRARYQRRTRTGSMRLTRWFPTGDRRT